VFYLFLFDYSEGKMKYNKTSHCALTNINTDIKKKNTTICVHFVLQKQLKKNIYENQKESHI